MVGLGVGTLAAYGRPGDRFRFYEINPDVIRLAREQFTYLDDSQADVEHVLGDARLSLEREPEQQFDLLVLDAFSSDAIPVHLLTEEAFAIYLRHLRDGGVLAFHITNRHFDLQPVVQGAANRYGLHAAKIHSDTVAERAQARCDWMLLTRDAALFTRPDLQTAIATTQVSPLAPQLWTDRFNNVVGILK
jgi:spermidine synthase